jgi:hypothetical protein
VTLYSTPNLRSFRLGAPTPGTGIAADRSGEAIEEGRRAERAANRFRSPKRRNRLGGDRRAEKVGEAAPAAIHERGDTDEPVVPAFEMRIDARPAPILGLSDKPRPDRVQSDIAGRRHQRRLVHDHGAETRLKEMARHPKPVR